jgi:hypothetical protein
MKNALLKRSLSDILDNTKNVKVKRGVVGGNSIEVEFINESSYDSFLYGDNETERDNDLKSLIELIKEKDGK